MKLASCKSAFILRWFILLTILRWWCRCFSLLFCGLFYEAICFSFCLVLFCSCVYQSFEHWDYIARGDFNAFHTFVRFGLVWFCLFPLPLGVWRGLQLVIVTLPGLFSLSFLSTRLFFSVMYNIYIYCSDSLMRRGS